MKPDINKLLNKPTQLYENFHHKTKLRSFNRSIKSKDFPIALKKFYYKGYPRFPIVKLPLPEVPKTSLSNALLLRASKRSRSGTKIDLRKISSLLYYSAGIRLDNSKQAKRFYPSAGARYPLELYIFSLDSSLPEGVYHYYVKGHLLEQLLGGNMKVIGDFFEDKWIENSSLIIVITAVFRRTTMKYADRGYRHILLEAGHLGQNIYLQCVAHNISCCTIGGYLDSKIEKIIGLDGITESIVNVVALG